MCNKALTKCRLLQKNCKKILWHKDGVGRRGADFSREWFSTFLPPDVYSYCLSPTCHWGHTTLLAGQAQTSLLFKPFVSEYLGQSPISLPLCYSSVPCQTTAAMAGEMLTLLHHPRDKFMAQKTWSWKWLYFLSTQFPPFPKYTHLNMPVIFLVDKYLEANSKKSIKCCEHSQPRCNFNLTNVL